jgi:Protein of unknown function (DUF2786)
MSIDRIAKLLQMAERAKTSEEAAAFFAKAQALASAHEISLAQARAHQPAAAREQPVQQMVTVGRPRQQANRHYLRLLVALARGNGCEIGLYNNNTAAVLFGLPSDIATVERLFAVIAPQMIRLGEEYLAAGRWRTESIVDLRTGANRPVTRQGARASFYQGFADTLAKRIRAAAQEARAEAEQAERSRTGPTDGAPSGHPPRVTGVELALRSKELDVRTFAQQHLGGGSWRGGRAPDALAVGPYRAGDRAAGEVRIGGADAIGGSRRAVGA